MTGLLLSRFATMGGPPPVLAYVAGVSMQDTTTPAAEQTFSSVNLGPAFTGRRIVLVVSSIATNTNGAGTIASISVGGTGATQRATNNPSDTNTIHTVIYDVTYATGSSADIVVTMDDPGDNLAIVMHAYALNSSLVFAAQGEDFTSPFQYTRTFDAGDIYVGGGRSISTATETWTNATEDGAISETGLTRWSSASYFPADAGSRTITFTPSNTGSALMISGVYS